MPDRFLKPQNTTQRIVGALVGTSAIAIATMIGMTVWLTTATNETTAEKSRKIVANAMTATLETLEWSIADYALWSDAHAIVDARHKDYAGHDHHRGHDGSDKSEEDDTVHRDAHAQEHLNQVFDAVYIIGQDGTLHVGLEADRTTVDPVSPQALVITQSRALAGTSDALKTEPRSGFVSLPEGPAIVALSWMDPQAIAHEEAHTGGSDEPHLMVGVQMLDATRLASIADRFLIANLQIAATSAATNAEMSRLPLFDYSGSEVTQLQWLPPRPGDELFKEATPIIAAFSVMLLSVSLLVGRATAAQTAAHLSEHALARTDRLTGLINRAGLDDILGAGPVLADLKRGAAALVYIDLNGFKGLNDQLGHDAGDRALQITAKRILASVREVDIVARLGGDEFVCVLLDEDPHTTARQVTDRIRENTDHPVHIRGNACSVGASIGVALAQPRVPWQRLLHQADIAMYHAKMSGKTTPVFFAQEMDRLDVKAARATRAA